MNFISLDLEMQISTMRSFIEAVWKSAATRDLVSRRIQSLTLSPLEAVDFNTW